MFRLVQIFTFHGRINLNRFRAFALRREELSDGQMTMGFGQEWVFKHCLSRAFWLAVGGVTEGFSKCLAWQQSPQFLCAIQHIFTLQNLSLIETWASLTDLS